MSRADLLKKIADHQFALAELFNELAESSAVSAAAPSGGVPTPDSDDLPEFPPIEGVESRPQPQGSLAMCPKHRKPYKDGKFGPFCTSTSDDPAWANAKGYCTINPKNVDVWLRAQAA